MASLRTLAEKSYALFCTAASSLQSPFLLAIRLYWGWQLAQSGWGKLHNLDGVTSFFASLNLPLPSFTAHLISCIEFFGGILFALGLISRPLSLVLVVTLTMAYITADREALMSVFSNPDKFYKADPYTFLFAALIVLIFGPGRFALDTLLARWLGSKPAPTK
jgi:putative oxidoreductase